MKKFLYPFLIIILCTPYLPLFAARIFVETTQPIHKGEKTTLLVKIDTEGEKINTLDGTISLLGFEKNILDIHTGGSAFTLWPTKPSLSGTAISFTGGIPSGIEGSNLLLFSVIARLDDPASSYLAFRNITAYMNDGGASTLSILENPVKLTELSIQKQSEQVHDSHVASQSDRVPPLPFTIELGRDDTLFDGKYFISFVGQDTASGINHYEIVEGTSSPVRSGSPYVLQDQTLSSKLSVTAFDNAGNTRIALLNPHPTPINWPSVIVLTVIIYTVLVLYRKRK
jgi:hypothetical protein